MEWRAGHLTTTEGTGDGAFANKNCPQGGHLKKNSNARDMPGGLPGGGMLAARIDSHIMCESILLENLFWDHFQKKLSNQAEVCRFTLAASIPPGKPRAFDARYVTGPGHLEFNSDPLGICKQEKTCFVRSCRHFRRRSESRVSNMVILEQEEHLSTIKDL